MPGYKPPEVIFSGGGSSSSSGSTNLNCNTASGVPNSWYSDFYPASTINAGTSTTISVTIRDCSKNAVGSDTLSISLNSGDSGTQINGSGMPYTVQTQSGQASFTVTSQKATTDTFTIKDTTSNFDVTDVNNNSLTIVFSGGSSSSPSPSPSTSSSPSPSPSPSPSSTSSPTASASATTSP